MRRLRIAPAVAVVLAVVSVAACTNTSSTNQSAQTPAEQEQRGIEQPSNNSVETSTTLVSSKNGPDPCSIFSVDEIAKVVGNSLSNGLPSGTGQSCKYGAADVKEASVLLTVEVNDTHEKFIDARRTSSSSGSGLQDVSGIGDEAFVFAPESSPISSAEARLGSIRIRIVISGDPSVDEARELLKQSIDRTRSGSK